VRITAAKGANSVKKKAYPVVEIKWMDAEADNSWVSEEDVAGDNVGDPVVTIGFLVRRPTRGFPMYTVAGTVAVVDSKTGETNFNTTIKIPKVWVKEFKILQEEYVIWQANVLSVS